MANYANLLATIAANIYTNGNQEVTAAMVKSAMNTAVASLGTGYQFMGVAHPADTPSGYEDLRAFWLAGEAGTYTNFGGLSVAEGEVAVLKYDTAWHKDVTGAATAAQVSELQQNFIVETELLSTELSPASANTSAAFAFATGKKYVIDVTWAYTSGYLASVAVRKGNNPLVRISNYFVASGSASFEYTANDDYTAIYIISGGSPIAGTVDVSIKEMRVVTVPEILNKIDEVENQKISVEKLEGVAKGAVLEAAGRLGYTVEVDGAATYASLQGSDFVAPIPIGATIKNNGVKVGLFSDATLSTRHDIANGQTWVATFEINVIRTLETAGDVRLEIDTRVQLLDGLEIDGETIKKDSVNIDRLSFVETGTNIYNKDADPDFAAGKYLNQWGSLNDNSSYNTSGYIKVEPQASYSYILDGSLRFMMEYDENFQAITSSYSQNIITFTTSENARYVRLTFYANAKEFLCKGSTPKPYEDYKIFIPSEYLQTGASGSELPFFLPKHIYVANGRTIEIYYNQVLLNADRYNIQATCPIGKALERKFQIIGDSTHIGNTYTLSLVAYNDAGDVVASGTSTIHIVSNTISASKNVLPVGDSLTNAKPWLSELHTLSANFNTVGTRQGIHEGRSGASVSTYTNVSGGIVYDYDNQYSDNSVPVFNSSASYGIGDKVKIAHTFGNGTSGYRYWVFKQAHSPGAFVESEAYCYSGGNPFYDYVNNKISFSFYRSFFGINYDAIILYLGTNGINLDPETNPNGALGIKNLIEYIREDEPTTPIVVINTIFRSNQNGIGNQGNTDGYVAQSAYKFNEDKKVLLLAKAVDDLCGSMSNVYLCPVGFTHDSKYNFGNNKVQVNPRLTSTEDVFELQPSDSVHPQNPGYMQMADEMFSTLCAIFGN